MPSVGWVESTACVMWSMNTMISSSSSAVAPAHRWPHCHFSPTQQIWSHRRLLVRHHRNISPAAALMTQQQRQHTSSSSGHTHGSSQSAAPHLQQRRRRRRNSSTADEQKKPIGSFEVDLKLLQEQQQQHHPTQLMLYIPVGFEAAAAEACRQAGYTLPASLSDSELAQETVAAAPNTAQSAHEEAAAAAAASTARAFDSSMVQEPHAEQLARQAAIKQFSHLQQLDQSASQDTTSKETKADNASLQQQQQQPVPAAPPSPEPAAAADTQPLAAWQIAVNRRVSSTASSMAPHTLSSSSSVNAIHLRSTSRTPASRKVALSRLSMHISNSSSSSRPASPTTSRAPALNRSSSSSSSSVVAGVLADLQPGQLAHGQRLSPEAEAELCSMYQVS
jgi:hypothetical protein